MSSRRFNPFKVRKPKPNRGEQKQHANQNPNNRAAAENEHIEGATRTNEAAQQTSNTEHSANERAMVRWTKAVAFLTGGLVFVAVITDIFCGCNWPPCEANWPRWQLPIKLRGNLSPLFNDHSSQQLALMSPAKIMGHPPLKILFIWTLLPPSKIPRTLQQTICE
jgi:hypothetical protein